VSVATSVDLSGLGPLDPAMLAGDDGLLLSSDDGWVVAFGAALPLRADRGIGELAEVTRKALAGLGTKQRGLERPPLALGVLPFDPLSPASLVVPTFAIFGKGDRPSDALVIAETGADSVSEELWKRLEHAQEAPAQGHGTKIEVSALDPPERYRAAVRSALLAISSGRVAKVVLARRVEARRASTFSRAQVLRAFGDSGAGATVFGIDGLVGATPELVVERNGARLASTPLAGSASESEIEAVRALPDSEKDRLEHRFVVDAIVERLSPYCDELDVPALPRVVRAGPVVHLATPISGTLARSAHTPSALHLAAVLHPTPAISGLPDEPARQLLAELEGWQRHRYGGLVGWVDGAGDGRFSLLIRAAKLEGDRAIVAAGAGIVAGSDPSSELEETALKLEAVLGALRRS